MEPKPVSASAMVDQIVELLPEDSGPEGTVIGGRLMQAVDNLAAIVAKRHTGRDCMTLGIDSVRFLNIARQEDVLICKASVNKAWDNSMEIGVKVIAEDFRTLEQKDILSAYFTFVAKDEQANPVPICAIYPETPEQIKRFERAEERRRHRITVDKSIHICS